MPLDPSSLRPSTRLVHGGTQRTPYGETAEALFLTSGYVYDSAEQAEATFTGTTDHYQYSRFANPTWFLGFVERQAPRCYRMVVHG
jgi:O-succinylhomoserine sulfhydrylase